MHARKTKLVGDQKGAVMVIGLFMAISLIGSLWFILGIGNAILTKDRGIEVADHAVFSGAAVHARGMNYIAALNLVMFAIAIIYVGLCVVADVIITIGNFGGTTQYNFGWFGKHCLPNPAALLYPELQPVAKAACNIGHKIAELTEKFNNDFVKPTYKGIDALETGVQIGFPAIAEVESIKIANDYNLAGFLIPTSLMPGVSQSDGPGKIGLPVTKQENKYLCKRAFNEVEKAIDDLIPAPFSSFIDLVMDVIEGYVDARPPKDTWLGIGCNGSPWTDKQIHLMAPGVENGDDHFQMWGLIVNATDKDEPKAYEKVSMAKNKGGTEAGSSENHLYYSQAEYFFDCEANWSESDCYDDKLKNASFSMNWKARIRRVHPPSYGNKAVGVATQALLAGNLTNFIAGEIAKIPAAGKIAGAIDGVMTGKLSGFLTGTGAGNDLNAATNFLTGADKSIH